MAVNLISYPFRLAPNGNVVVRPDDDEAYYAEELACLALTVPGERELVPQYGLEDPTFGDFVREELKAKVDMFGPPVRIEGVNVDFPRQGVMSVGIVFNDQETAFTYYTEEDVEDESGD